MSELESPILTAEALLIASCRHPPVVRMLADEFPEIAKHVSHPITACLLNHFLKSPQEGDVEGFVEAELGKIGGDIENASLSYLQDAKTGYVKAPVAKKAARDAVKKIIANPTNQTNRLTGHNARDLLDIELPEPKFIIQGILPEGLAILGGHPKLGKSWMMLSNATAVACGGRAFGQIEVEVGDVLYLALEDTPRRMKSRLIKQLAGQRPDGLQRLHIEYEWPRTNEGGLQAIRKWLIDHPNARLVVIDTLQKIKPRRNSGGSIYESDSDDVGDLKALSDEFGVAIVCVHHLRKGDGDDPVEALSGSYGLSGAADTLLILQRVRGQVDATLFVTGRDVDESEHALKFDKDLAQWNLLGDAAEYKLTGERQAVLHALRTMDGRVTPSQLWQRSEVGKNLNNLKQLLWQMSKNGEVQTEGGKYWVSPVSPVSPVSKGSEVSEKTAKQTAINYGND